MSLILVTKEQADEHSLMHYRTKGSKNGQRLYQYKDGSLTPLGRIHYGIGQARDKKAADKKESAKATDNNSNSAGSKSAKYESIKNALDRGDRKEVLKSFNDMKQDEFKDVSEKLIGEIDEIFKNSSDDSKHQRYNDALSDAIYERLPKNVFDIEAKDPISSASHLESELNIAQQNRRKEIEKEIGFEYKHTGPYSKNTSSENSDADWKRLDEALLRDPKMKELKEKEISAREQLVSEIINTAGMSDTKQVRDWVEPMFTGEVLDRDYGAIKGGKSSAERLAEYDRNKDAKPDSEKKPNLIERVNERIEKKAEANRPETRKEERQSEKELEKKITSGIENFNKKSAEKAEERSADTKSFQDVMKSIRGMSDEELNKNIDRLQREKRYSELLQDQRAREKGPIYTMVSKALKNAADDLTKKSLTMAVDKLISKAKGEKKGFTLNDYKDVDLYSLDSDKLNAVSQAFNNAANIALNKWKIEHPGQDPNQQNNQNGGKNNNQSQGKSKDDSEKQNQNGGQSDSQNQNGSQDGTLSKNQRKKIRSLAASGKSAAELAKQFGVSESTIYQYAGSQFGDQKGSGGSNDNSSKPSASDRAKTAYPNGPRNILKSASDVRKNSEATNRSFTNAMKRSQSAINAALKEGRNVDAKNERDRKFDEYTKWLSGDAWEREKASMRTEQAERERREEEERRRRRERNARNGLII